jgi:hypothetical protein
MGRHAKSNLVKRKTARDDYKVRMERAINMFRAGLMGADGKAKKLGDIAIDCDVSYSTLCRRVKPGAVGIDEFNQTKQRLSSPVEDELVKWCLEYANRNIGLTNSLLEERANEILKARDPNAKPVGATWITRFMARHHDTLRHHWSCPLDRVRITSSTQEAVDKYFEHYISIVGKDGGKIDPALQYAFDETGLQPSMSRKQRVIGDAKKKGTRVAKGSNRQNTTFVPVISGDGKFILGLMIYAGEFLHATYVGTKGNPHNLVYVMS